MAWERVGRELLGYTWRGRAAALATAVALGWLASANALGVPYPPINRFAVWGLLGGLGAIVAGYYRGGVVLGLLVPVLAVAGARGADPLGAVLGIALILLAGWGFLGLYLPSAVTLGVLGHAGGEWLRRHRGRSTTAVGAVLLGDRLPHRLAFGGWAVVLVAVSIWQGLGGFGAGPRIVSILAVAGAITLAAAIGVARGGLAVAILGLVGPAVAYVGVATAAAGVRDSIVVGNTFGTLGGIGAVAAASWALGRGARAAWRLIDGLREADRGAVRERLAATRAAVGGRPAVRIFLIAGAIVLLYGVPWTPVLEPVPPTDLDDTAIVLDRGPCNGSCPIYTVRICGDGTVHYEGHEFTRVTGYRQLEIPRERVREILDTVYETDFYRLRGGYSVPITDLPSTRVTVKIGFRSRTVDEYGGGGPARLHRLQGEIDAVVGDLNEHAPENRDGRRSRSMPETC